MQAAFYDRATVCRLTTLSSVTLWRHTRDGEFPAPIRISRGRVAWPAAQVDQWIAEKLNPPVAA